MRSPLQQAHLRVTDAATGQPTPVRLRVTDAAGAYCAPLGRLTRFATGPNQDVGGNVMIDRQPWAYIDGACEIKLPPGKLRFQISKGPEYRAIDAAVSFTPGKLSLRLQIERWTDERQAGWHSGDARAHFISPHAALLEAAAEDLAVANLLIRATETPGPGGVPVPAVPLLDAFSGQAPCLARAGHLVAVNTENFHPLLGSLGLLFCHRVVHPLRFGGPAGHEDWRFADWCGQCHRKNGLVAWTRTEHETPYFRFGAPLVDVVLGDVDAFELTPLSAGPLWYELLNVGLRVPLAGASGKESNATALGDMRTYVHTGEAQCSYAAWIEGLRAGRSYVTRGPLLQFHVNGHAPGSTVAADAGRVSLAAAARSMVPFETLEVVRGFEIVASISASRIASAGGPASSASILQEIPVQRGGWLAARCIAGSEVVAHTSPVYLEVAGKPALVDADAASRLRSEIERLIAWGETTARCSTPAQRDRLTAGFRKARDLLGVPLDDLKRRLLGK